MSTHRIGTGLRANPVCGEKIGAGDSQIVTAYSYCVALASVPIRSVVWWQ
ncbi:hypothetical protein [Escherichia coli]